MEDALVFRSCLLRYLWVKSQEAFSFQMGKRKGKEGRKEGRREEEEEWECERREEKNKCQSKMINKNVHLGEIYMGVECPVLPTFLHV